MFDFSIGFFRVVATTVSKAAKAVLETLDAGGVGSGDKEHWPEGAIGQPSFGQVGLVVRPRGPTKDGQAERIALDSGDGLIPFAGRDLRLNRFYPSPKDGAVALVGYAGAFDSNEPTFDAGGKPKSTERVTYVPYAFDDNGVPTKAHTIEIIGTAGNESISIIHGDGMAITMKAGGKNSVVVKNKAGNAYVEVNDDGITVNGNTVINGGATIGSPVGALPAAIAPQVVAYLSALEVALLALAATVDTKLPPAPGAGVGSLTAAIAAMATAKAAIPALKTSIA